MGIKTKGLGECPPHTNTHTQINNKTKGLHEIAYGERRKEKQGLRNGAYYIKSERRGRVSKELRRSSQEIGWKPEALTWRKQGIEILQRRSSIISNNAEK